MTEQPGTQNKSAEPSPPAANTANTQLSAGAAPAYSGKTAAALQSAELGNNGGSLKAEPVKAADPFFSGRKHFPELDGLRGLAILLVLFCHYAFILPIRSRLGASLEILSFQGWIGVTLFFVLSGFLITGILYDAKGQSHYFRNFYARRTLRIFPLYYGILGVELLILLAIMLGSPHAWAHLHNPRKLWAAMPWLWTYTTNIGQSFFHVDTVLQNHFWSLAVEEQFYLVWPALVFLLSGKEILRACAALIALAFATRLALVAAGDPTSAYGLTPCQFDALGLGAMVAILSRDASHFASLKRYANWTVLICGPLVAVVFSSAIALRLNPTLLGGQGVRIADAQTHAPWLHFGGTPWLSTALYAPLDLMFAGMLAAAVTGSSAIFSRICRLGFLRKLGKYSYGLYVFHFIVFMVLGNLLIRFPRIRHATVNHLLPAIGLLLANLFLSLALAYASYHLYEKHLLKLKRYFPEKTAA